jgi:general secretion pathway protein L
MLKELLIWWAHQMRGLIPEGLVQNDPLANALIVETDLPGEGDASRVKLIRRRGRRETILGGFHLDAAGAAAFQGALATQPRPRSIVLRLPASALLERRVALPLAAERAPQRVLEYEMGRLTPFSAAELFWSWQVERRDRPRGLLHVRLFLVSKAALEPLTQALERAGLRPTMLEAPAAGTTRRIWLHRGQSARDTWRRRALTLAAGACAALAVAAVGLPFILQASATAALDNRIAELRPAVTRAEALRDQIARAAAGGDVVSAEQARVGDALEVLAAVTDLLPDDTYLTDFSLRERKLELSGESGAAARLISVLSADAAFRNPVFAAPVTHLGSATKELFSIRAEIAR